MESSSSLEQILQDAKLHRQLNSLIVAHLRDNNLTQAASAVASATMTLLNVEASPNKLLELVAKALAVEKDEASRGVTSASLYDLGIIATRHIGIMISVLCRKQKAYQKVPKHETRHLSEHKNIARCARFSPDGRFVATGSANTSIKLFEAEKEQQ